MFLKRKIIRSIYNEIEGFFKYSLTEEEVINQELRDKKVKAKEVPFNSYNCKKGGSLQYAMAMIYRLRQNDIKSFLGIYKGEGIYSEDSKYDYAFVIYREAFFRWYIAEFKMQEPKDNIQDPARIEIAKFRKLKGKLWVYNPYDEHLGNLPIFGGFFDKPKIIIK